LGGWGVVFSIKYTSSSLSKSNTEKIRWIVSQAKVQFSKSTGDGVSLRMACWRKGKRG
jgi:hypothetical protein